MYGRGLQTFRDVVRSDYQCRVVTDQEQINSGPTGWLWRNLLLMMSYILKIGLAAWADRLTPFLHTRQE